MKKHIIAIVILSAALSLTGCSININDETMSAAKDVAVSMLDDADIKVNGQSVDVTVDSNGDVNVSLGQTTAQTDSTASVSAKIADIAGTWNEADTLDSRTLTIKADGSFSLAYRGGGAQNGTVKIETTENPDGSQVIWYNFYETDGKFWTGFQKTASPQNDLYSGQDGAMHFVRATETNSQNTSSEETNIRGLVGEWHYQEQDPQNGEVYNNAGFVTVNADSTYSFQPSNGSVLKKGTIKIEYDEYSDGSKVPLFAFYEDDGTFWNGVYCSQNEKDIYYFGNGGTQRIIRKTNDENPFDEYIGTWQCDRCSIRIGDLGLVEIHWADSASEDNVWEYSCIYSEDGTYMECLGGGTLTHIVTAEDGTETRTVVYNDGTAKFSVRGGTLFWQDGKENKGDQMGFQKIG